MAGNPVLTETPPGQEWEPGASLELLKQRAQLLASIRDFFHGRGVMEVETPVLSPSGNTDPNIESLRVSYQTGDVHNPADYFLATSPEYHMKRLLAAGSGPIFQISRVFRAGEYGRLHNPEFTMLEWYRPGFDQHRLMDEVEALLDDLMDMDGADRQTYAQAFIHHAGIDPFTASEQELCNCASHHGVRVASDLEQRDGWLDLLMSHVVGPRLGQDRPAFIYDFPASQAALARIRPGRPPLAERFELYIKGIELANGYHELTDADEQQQRFRMDLVARKLRGQRTDIPPDSRLVQALQQGLPASAGVALGLDRLLMVLAGRAALRDVMAFDFSRA